MPKTEKGIYELKLHERIKDDFGGRTNIEILRVSGGWLYTRLEGFSRIPTFVPFSDEFKPTDPPPNSQVVAP